MREERGQTVSQIKPVFKQNTACEKIKEGGENQVMDCEKKGTRKVPQPLKPTIRRLMWKFMFD